MKKITLLLVLASYVSFAQEYTYIDFGITGTNETPGNWNNVAVANAADAAGITLGLIEFSNGNSTGVTLTVDDAFDTVNTAGNPSPDPSLPFPTTAAVDSFFGETATFNGTLEPTGGFTLTGLDPTKYYSFSIFASRNGVGDNREAQYTLVGSTTAVVALNASNNTANTADVFDLQANGSGEIVFTAAPGPNNNNGSGFYYLGAIEMIKSDTPLSVDAFRLKDMLSVYPNPVNDIFEVKLDLLQNSDVKIEVYDVNGRMITNLFEGQQPAGEFRYQLESAKSNLSTGTYFLKVNVNDQVQTTKLFIK